MESHRHAGHVFAQKLTRGILKCAASVYVLYKYYKSRRPKQPSMYTCMFVSRSTYARCWRAFFFLLYPFIYTWSSVLFRQLYYLSRFSACLPSLAEVNFKNRKQRVLSMYVRLFFLVSSGVVWKIVDVIIVIWSFCWNFQFWHWWALFSDGLSLLLSTSRDLILFIFRKENLYIKVIIIVQNGWKSL